MDPKEINPDYRLISDSQYIKTCNYSEEVKAKRREKYYKLIKTHYPNAKIINKHDYSKLAQAYNEKKIDAAEFLENLLGDIFKPVVYFYVNHNIDAVVTFEDSLSVAYISARDFIVNSENFIPEKKSVFVFVIYGIIHQGVSRYYNKSLRRNAHLAYSWVDFENVLDVDYFTQDSDDEMFKEDVINFVKMLYNKKFTPNQKNVFDMLFIGEMSCTEIAKILGISRNRVNQLEHKIKNNVAKELNKPHNFEIVQ